MLFVRACVSERHRSFIGSTHVKFTPLYSTQFLPTPPSFSLIHSTLFLPTPLSLSFSTLHSTPFLPISTPLHLISPTPLHPVSPHSTSIYFNSPGSSQLCARYMLEWEGVNVCVCVHVLGITRYSKEQLHNGLTRR